MAMIPGVNVVVADNETVSAGTGLKLELYTADIATADIPPVLALASTAFPYSAGRPASAADVAATATARLMVLRDAARRANYMAAALSAHITTNAKARIGPAVAGVQKTPNPNDPATATAAHGGANIDLPIV